MSYFKQDHTGTDNSATGMTQSRQAVEAEAGRPGPPQRRDKPVYPDDHSAVLRTLVTGPQNGIPQEQYLHSIDIANQQLGNRAFMHWVGALRATGQGGQAHAGSVQGRQDPAGSRTRSAPLQLMPKKRKQKEPAAEIAPEGQTEAAPETGAPDVPGAAPESAAQTVAEAAGKQTQAEAKEPAGPGDKRSKKKSRVQQALNALREEGVEAFRRFIEARIGETALLDTLTERVQRAEDLRGVRDAALGVIAARMGELDPEAVPMVPRALAPVRREFAERPVAAPIKKELETREEELVDCCFRNNAARFRNLLKFGRVNGNLATESGPLLFISAINGHTAIVKALLSMSGIDVNLAQEKGATPLFAAAQQGHVEIVRLLMNAPGINPGLGSFREGTSPLAVAALLGRVEVVKMFLSFRQVNINIRQYDGATPLFAAVQNDHPEVVELLISEGADATIPLLDGTTPLCRAAYQGSNEALKHLLRVSGNEINLRRIHKMPPCYMPVNRVTRKL